MVCDLFVHVVLIPSHVNPSDEPFRGLHRKRHRINHPQLCVTRLEKFVAGGNILPESAGDWHDWLFIFIFSGLIMLSFHAVEMCHDACAINCAIFSWCWLSFSTLSVPFPRGGCAHSCAAVGRYHCCAHYIQVLAYIRPLLSGLCK